MAAWLRAPPAPPGLVLFDTPSASTPRPRPCTFLMDNQAEGVNGDIAQAFQWLRKRGIAKATSMADRSANEGTLFAPLYLGYHRCDRACKKAGIIK